MSQYECIVLFSVITVFSFLYSYIRYTESMHTLMEFCFPLLLIVVSTNQFLILQKYQKTLESKSSIFQWTNALINWGK